VETVTNRKNAKKAGNFTPFCDWQSTTLPMLDFRATLRMKHVQQQRSRCGAKIFANQMPLPLSVVTSCETLKNVFRPPVAA